MKIILASSSPYRKELLNRLQIQFDCLSPDIIETINPELSFRCNAMELSRRKAQAIVKHHPDDVIIASDQICVINGKVNGKPGNFENAVKQLRMASGKKVKFYTGLCVYYPQEKEFLTDCDKTTVCFRDLTDDEISKYLKKEKPFNCAGSFKAESLGITLFEKIENTDPTALIGLPLIKLTTLLKSINISFLNS